MSVAGEDPAASTPAAASQMRGQLYSLAKIGVLDVAAPLVMYKELRSAGLSTATALIISGVFPALDVAIDVIRHRRLSVVGAVVLAGIVIGALLGLATHNARLVLMESSVPTGIFGLACLASLPTAKPFMYGMALEFIGPDTAKGREMVLFWQHPEFRRSFRIITLVWGIGFFVEAATRVVIVEETSTSTALAISKVMPFIFVGVLLAWTFGYGAYKRRTTQPIAGAPDS